MAVVNANTRKLICKCQGIQNAFNSKKCTVAVVLNQPQFHINIMAGGGVRCKSLAFYGTKLSAHIMTPLYPGEGVNGIQRIGSEVDFETVWTIRGLENL